jgi:hypothetical protein
VLRDAETGRLGSSSQFIQVPDLSKKQLTLSGLLVSAPHPKAGGDASPGDAPEALHQTHQTSGTDPQPTAAVRRFARTSELGYGAWIFNATLDKRTKQPQLTMQIEIFHRGQRVYQAPAHPVKIARSANLKRIACGGQLKLTGFPLGDFLLRLIVTDALAKQKYSRVDQWMDFSVR